MIVFPFTHVRVCWLVPLTSQLNCNCSKSSDTQVKIRTKKKSECVACVAKEDEMQPSPKTQRMLRGLPSLGERILHDLCQLYFYSHSQKKDTTMYHRPNRNCKNIIGFEKRTVCDKRQDPKKITLCELTRVLKNS